MGADPDPLNDDAESGDDRPNTDVPDLCALVDGYWTAWHGLDPLPTEAEVAMHIGASIDDQRHGGVLGGSPTEFRRYRPDENGPEVTVWFEGDAAVAVQLENLGQSPLDAPLESPEMVVASAFGDEWEQRVYGSRGLVVHVRPSDDEEVEAATPVALVFGLAPFDSAEFRNDPIRFEGGSRRRPQR